MKFLSWMQNKIGGKQDNRKPDTYTTTTYDGKQEGREEFSDWPDGLLAIGTFGNNNEAKEKRISTSTEDPSSSQQIPDFTPEEIGQLQKELTKLLRQKPKVEKEIAHLPLDRFLNCPSSLEVDRRISNVLCSDSENKDYDEEEEEKQEREEEEEEEEEERQETEEDIEKTLSVILGKFKEICAKNSKKAIGKKSIAFLLKKMFVCRSGFAPPPSLRDTLQLQESRMEKLLRTILHKKINSQHSSRAVSMKKRLEDRQKMPMEEEAEEKAEAETDDGCKWVKTDSEYIVLEI